MLYRGSLSVVVSQERASRQFLFAQRHSKRWDKFLVTGPQGRNDGECPYNALVREAREECGIGPHMISLARPLLTFRLPEEDSGILITAYALLIPKAYLRQLKEHFPEGELSFYALMDRYGVEWLLGNGDVHIQPHCEYVLRKEGMLDFLCEL